MQSAKNARKLSPRRLCACVGVSLGAIILAGAGLVLVFDDTLLNSYGKREAERAFAEAHRGWELRIGEMEYSPGLNRLIAQSVILIATNTMVKAGRISLTGVRWSRLFWGRAALSSVLAEASLDATNIEAQFPQARYRIRCARLRASAPGSELTAEGIELRTLVGDEQFFAAHEFRTTRFHLVVPECKVSGLAYDELLQGKSYRARAIHVSRPSLDALVDRDKPVGLFVKSPLMVNEALAAIQQPLQIDSLTITNGSVRYCEQVVAGADPGVLTISAVNLSAEGIANRGEASASILIRAQANLMESGSMNVRMTIPITPTNFSLHYSGSLGGMDLTRLDAFLDIAEHTRIKSGNVQEASFDIDVTAGQARGYVRGAYQNLEIAFLDKKTGTEKRFDHRVASFLANVLKIRSSNTQDASGSMKEGEVNYTRRQGDEFQQFAWFALRTGVLDVISH